MGKRVRGALYVHRSAASALDPARQAQLKHAAALLPHAPWNVARLAPDHTGLLAYEPFEAVAFPSLLEAWRVEQDPVRISHRNYRGADNPLILHRKELLTTPEVPGHAAWTAFTKALETRGLFTEPHLIGRRRQWEARLAAAGLRVEGHTLCPA